MDRLTISEIETMREVAWMLVCIKRRKRSKEVIRQANKDADAILRKIRRMIRSRIKP